MYATVAEMIVVITRFVVIVTVNMTRTVNFMAVLVRVDRHGVDCLRHGLEPGEYDSGEDGNNHESVHRVR